MDDIAWEEEKSSSQLRAAAGRKNTGNSETDDILRDPVVMKMLESADRQYKEGKAIPLSKLMSDLGFEEDGRACPRGLAAGGPGGRSGLALGGLSPEGQLFGAGFLEEVAVRIIII